MEYRRARADSGARRHRGYVVLAHSLVDDVDRELVTRSSLAAARLVERPVTTTSSRARATSAAGSICSSTPRPQSSATPSECASTPRDVEQYPAAGPQYTTMDLDDGPARLYLAPLPPRRHRARWRSRWARAWYRSTTRCVRSSWLLLAAGAVGIAFSILGRLVPRRARARPHRGRLPTAAGVRRRRVP